MSTVPAKMSTVPAKGQWCFVAGKYRQVWLICKQNCALPYLSALENAIVFKGTLQLSRFILLWFLLYFLLTNHVKHWMKPQALSLTAKSLTSIIHHQTTDGRPLFPLCHLTHTRAISTIVTEAVTGTAKLWLWLVTVTLIYCRNWNTHPPLCTASPTETALYTM